MSLEDSYMYNNCRSQVLKTTMVNLILLHTIGQYQGLQSEKPCKEIYFGCIRWDIHLVVYHHICPLQKWLQLFKQGHAQLISWMVKRSMCRWNRKIAFLCYYNPINLQSQQSFFIFLKEPFITGLSGKFAIGGWTDLDRRLCWELLMSAFILSS